MEWKPERYPYLAAIVEFSDDAIISKDLTGTVISWNPAATRIFGYTPEEIIGKSILTLIPPDLYPEEEEVLARIRAGMRIDHYETRRLRKDGSLIEVSLTISPIRDQAGRLIGATKIARDISSRNVVDHAMRRLAAIVESSNDGIIAMSLGGTITSWNSAASRIFGYALEEVVGRSILMLIPPELHREEHDILARLSLGDRIDHYETRRIRKDGTAVDVSLTISPIKDSNGRIIGASKIARDVTDKRRTEEALHRSEKLAVAGRLAATVAHEINNPLAAITNLVYLVKTDDSLSGETKRRMEIIEEELERVSSIARQTLGFYRDTSSPTEVTLAEVVEEVLGIFGRRMLARQITLHREFRDLGRVFAFKGEIRQIISNIVANAIDATPAGGRIVIRLEKACRRHPRTEAGIRLTVADTGHGIPHDMRPKLFHPFFTTNKETGTGLGLWHTSGLVKKHGGIIQFRSTTRPGRTGTVFSVFLPSAQAAVASRRIA